MSVGAPRTWKVRWSAAALFIGAELVAAWFAGRNARIANKRVQSATQEWTEHERQNARMDRSGSLTDEDLYALKDRLADARKRVLPTADKNDAELESVSRSDAYFRISAVLDRIRAEADEASVKLSPSECFGFASYSHRAPEREDVGSTLRDLAMAESLLTALIEAGPDEIVSVQREVESASASKGKETDERDRFTFDRMRSIRRLVGVEGVAWRIAFIGRTETLRRWLNWLAKDGRPFWVAGVEATRASAKGNQSRSVASVGSRVVDPIACQFVVTVEALSGGESKEVR